MQPQGQLAIKDEYKSSRTLGAGEFKGISGISFLQQQLILNQNRYKSMDNATPVIFQCTDISAELLQNIALKNVEAEVLLFIARPPTSQNEHMQDQTSNQEVLLQVVDQFIVQQTPDRTKVVSIVKCHYEIQFQMLRKLNPIPNKVGQISGIRFLPKDMEGQVKHLEVRSQHRSDLEKFGRILGRKFIVQLGFHSSFKANKKIGKGMTACVYNAVNLANGREVAIKSFKRSVYFGQDNGNGKISFMKQFKILTEVNHKNICQLYSVFETENSTYVILELYPLSLYGYLQKCGFPNMEQAKSIMINLLEGVAYLHERGIMHRDLKLENIMVKRDDIRSGRVIPVIVDLGLAEYLSSTKYLYTRCGTPGYVAPEVLKIKSTDPVQTYTCACDVFSLGVIFHILLFKKPVFEGKEVRQVIKKNCQCEINTNSQNFKSLDEQGRDLLLRMLCKDPKNRITAAQALEHPFLIEQKKQLDLEAGAVFRTGISL